MDKPTVLQRIIKFYEPKKEYLKMNKFALIMGYSWITITFLLGLLIEIIYFIEFLENYIDGELH